jgi:hypothetical protein
VGKQVGGQVRKEVWELSAAILCVALRMLLLTAFPLTRLPAYPLTRLPAYLLLSHVAGSKAIWFSPLISKCRCGP